MLKPRNHRVAHATHARFQNPQLFGYRIRKIDDAIFQKRYPVVDRYHGDLVVLKSQSWLS